MRRLLIAGIACASFVWAGTASAETQSYIYTSTSASGNSSASVDISQVVRDGVSGGVRASLIAPIQPRMPVEALPPVPPTVPIQPGPHTQSNRSDIRIRTSGGSTTIRVYREENGRVVEDKTLTVPPGQPVSIGSLPAMPTVSPPARDHAAVSQLRDQVNVMRRSMASSSGRASATTSLPWIGGDVLFLPFSVAGASSSLSGDLMLFKTHESAIESFINRILDALNLHLFLRF